MTTKENSVKRIEKSYSALSTYTAKLKRNGRMTDIMQEALEKAKTIRSNYTTIIYIAGGLTGMSEEVKARYATLSALIASYEGMFGYAPHLHGTDPVAHPHVTPEEVRDIDYLFSALVPDYHINWWHPVAHGNAVEAGWAELMDIPSIYLIPEDVIPSRLIRGMHNIATTITYTDFNDGLSQLQDLSMFAKAKK